MLSDRLGWSPLSFSPICFELINEAYVSRCGHSFWFVSHTARLLFHFLFCSSKCLQRTVESHHRCPKCQLSLQSSDIFPNYTRSFPNFCYQRRRRFSFSSQCDHRKISSTTSITTNVWQIWRKRRERRRRAGGKNYGDCLEYR